MDDFDGNWSGEIDVGDVVQIQCLPEMRDYRILWRVEAIIWEKIGDPSDNICDLERLDEFDGVDRSRHTTVERRHLRLVRKKGKVKEIEIITDTLN